MSSDQVIYKSPYGHDVPLPETSLFTFLWQNPNNVEDSKVVYIDGASGRSITRRELRESSQKLAHTLVHDFGLKQGQVVGAFSPNTIEYPIIVHACFCAGLVFSGANAAYTPDELVHQMSDADAKVLFCHPDNLPIAKQAMRKVGWSESDMEKKVIFAVYRSQVPDKTYRALDEIFSKSFLQPVKIERPKEHVALLGFSSGTTSAAKDEFPLSCTKANVRLTPLLSITGDVDSSQHDFIMYTSQHIWFHS